MPVTVVPPLVEETLRSAGVVTNRDLILDYYSSGHPRIAVVHGGADHPPNAGMHETIRRVIRFIWAGMALPFEVTQSVPCEELARGTEAASYALLSRNFCATTLAAQMEAHAYDAAIVIGACDKMLVGNLRGLVEADFARQRSKGRRGRPVFAMVLPSLIGREPVTSDEDRRQFDPLRARMPDAGRHELDALLRRPMKPAVFAGMKSILDRCAQHRLIPENEKNNLERIVTRCAASPGASCAASEASVVHRLIVASFGLVPRHCDIAHKPVSDAHLSDAVKRLVSAVRKRERRVSVSSLVRSNISNAASVWSAAGGHPAWILHLPYLADAVGKKMAAADVIKRARSVPQILGIEDEPGKSVYALAVEADAGGNSGIDTIMRTLSEKRWIEDRAITLEGSWAHRIMEARSANGNFLHSTMTPFAKSCGVSGISGNVCEGAVVRVGKAGFDQKVYLAVAYLGIQDLQSDLGVPNGISERLKQKITREDLYDTWLLNWGSNPENDAEAMSHWSKAHLWDYLVEQQLLRMMVVVMGVGPHAAGMPEIQLPDGGGVVMTDGRAYSQQPFGVSIAHVIPEAIDDGPIAAIRTGDWIHLNLGKGEVNVVVRTGRQRGFKVLGRKELMNRPDRRKRVNEIARQRLGLLPSFRILLDNVSSADSGVSPVLISG